MGLCFTNEHNSITDNHAIIISILIKKYKLKFSALGFILYTSACDPLQSTHPIFAPVINFIQIIGVIII